MKVTKTVSQPSKNILKKQKLKNKNLIQQVDELKLQLEYVRITVPKIMQRIQLKMDAEMGEFLNLLATYNNPQKNLAKKKNKFLFILKKINNLKIKPEKGRIKDLERIKKIVEEIKKYNHE